MKTLTELEANKLLQEAGINMAKTQLAKEKSDLKEISKEIKFPVVMKILSADILHKTEAKGVKLNINSLEEMENSFEEIIENGKNYNPEAKIEGVIVQEMLDSGLELIFGVNKDEQFGHTIVFGMGGIYVEVYKDIALRLLPLEEKEARKMVEETKISQILKGERGHKYDIDEIVDVLLKLSKLIEKDPTIREIDINPYILYEDGKKGAGADALIMKD